MKIYVQKELGPESAPIVRSDYFDWGFIELAEIEINDEKDVDRYIEFLRKRLIELLQKK